MNLLADLFFTFANIGLFTFGGGYAMLSMIEHHCVEQKQWITHDEMMNITVIAESTPGPIAINCATFTGYRQARLFRRSCRYPGHCFSILCRNLCHLPVSGSLSGDHPYCPCFSGH